ncbi:MAG: glycosyltransferase family 2 protein [Patescibacteria group bacterium]|nr:glycosyltransferase family 2 protein [Patescibacteria group bacterium]
MSKLSGVIVTDHYDNLTYNAINSLLRISDEIVIVESKIVNGKISSNFKKNPKINIIKLKKNLNYSEFKNVGLKHAKNDWVLFLDSDEVLSDSLIKQIPELIQHSDIEGYWFSRRNYYSNDKYFRYGLFYPDFQIRLFQNRSYYFFSGVVHTHLNIDNKKTIYKSIDILHFSRNSKYSKFSDFKNFFPYIQAESKELLEKNKNNSSMILFLKGFLNWIIIFFSGYIRGKGFLDGWAGFRAHILFASYISCIYFVAGIKLIRKTYH